MFIKACANTAFRRGLLKHTLEGQILFTSLCCRSWGWPHPQPGSSRGPKGHGCALFTSSRKERASLSKHSHKILYTDGISGHSANPLAGLAAVARDEVIVPLGTKTKPGFLECPIRRQGHQKDGVSTGEAMNRRLCWLGGYLQNQADPCQPSFCFLFLGQKH